jgi:hypothetical protein
MDIKEALTFEGLKYFFKKYIRPIQTKINLLGQSANCEVVNNATTNTVGTVLDGRMGKTLKDEITNIDAKTMNKYAVGIGNAPSIKYSYFVDATSVIPLGNINVPNYSKGIFITNGGSDGCLLMVDPQCNLYVGFRNGSSWTGRKI